MNIENCDAAFCSAQGPDVFRSVAQAGDIWRNPHDVEFIHKAAREVFSALLERAAKQDDPAPGRILLLLGESGAGKTHLMRAFRKQIHDRGLGHFSYMQMTSGTGDYGHYLLSNTIDALDKPYAFGSGGGISGLMRLSNALLENSQTIPAKAVEALRERNPQVAYVARFIDLLADRLLLQPRFASLDVDLLRAFLYLQLDDSRYRSRALKYLRGDSLSDYDRKVVGALSPRIGRPDPELLIEHLGKLIWALDAGPLVICLDQLENVYLMEERKEKFHRLISAVTGLADRVPSIIFVLSCLQDLYVELKTCLNRSFIDRIERDPEPVTLNSQCSSSEVEQLVSQRLAELYTCLSVQFDGSTRPFSAEALQQLDGQRVRDVLEWCRRCHRQAIADGRIPENFTGLASVGPGTAPKRMTAGIEHAWNDFYASFTGMTPDSDGQLLGLLNWGIKACELELDGERRIITQTDLNTIQVDIGHSVQLLVGLCNKNPQGGALARQIDTLVRRAGDWRVPVVVRTTAFAYGANTKIARQLGELIKQGGRRILIEDSDWRKMLAMRMFRKTHEQQPEFSAWLKADKPLTQLPSLRQILTLDETATAEADKKPLATTSPLPPAAPHYEGYAQQPVDDSPIVLGRENSRGAAPVTIELDTLARHAAFLGGTGSGKTTLALNVVEQLLLREIPVALIDRKGDLCNYASAQAWNTPQEDRDREETRDYLRDRIETTLYTPGNSGGRPLSIPLAPAGLGNLPANEREQHAKCAAFAMGGMMAYKQQGADGSRLAILSQAINLLSELYPSDPVILEELIRLIHEQDSALINAIGHLDTKHFKKLADDLETLRLNNGNLLAAEDNLLDVAALLGLGPYARPGRTRLSIISTRHLGGNANILFWVSQFLQEVNRYCSLHPSNTLQAVLLFDEADLYLPAQSKPATKEPMENALKRFRSAGFGILLATQSPGDLDYKSKENIGTWFVSRIKEQTALNKLKPLFSNSKTDMLSKLPFRNIGEFFMFRDGKAINLLADQSLIRVEQIPEEIILELASQG
ncbi:MAG: DUF853 family protein [Gammaproteobacteria bacterium]|nr:DUF853 family protein [Gammaproteobacteria bacterium]